MKGCPAWGGLRRRQAGKRHKRETFDVRIRGRACETALGSAISQGPGRPPFLGGSGGSHLIGTQKNAEGPASRAGPCPVFYVLRLLTSGTVSEVMQTESIRPRKAGRIGAKPVNPGQMKWRRERDSNPRSRIAGQRLSRPPPSSTRPSLRVEGSGSDAEEEPRLVGATGKGLTPDPGYGH